MDYAELRESRRENTCPLQISSFQEAFRNAFRGENPCQTASVPQMARTKGGKVAVGADSIGCAPGASERRTKIPGQR